ncbi:hypothetical protein GCM10009863_39600 [Streptomyces axinellae]|uniref:HTH lysR-type domain-containing protein n=1 Tax=Streptomyces axinellae TaxID=552788 RepID=A0ABN3QB20_9ACTN
MDVRQLEYFLAIVDHRGFNRAASALYLSQPSLSQAVRGLERDLGSALFHRIGRRAVLTEAGTALIEPALAALRSLETARASVAAVHELRAGRVDVAAMPSQAFGRYVEQRTVEYEALFAKVATCEDLVEVLVDLSREDPPGIAVRSSASSCTWRRCAIPLCGR